MHYSSLSILFLCADGSTVPRISFRSIPSVTVDDALPTAYYTDNSALSYHMIAPLVNLTTYNYTRMTPMLWTYFNGQRLFTQSSVQNGEFIEAPTNLQANYTITSQSEAIITLSIPRVPETFKGGICEFVFLIGTNQANLNCCESYNQLLTSSDGIDLQYFVIGLAAVSISLASKNAQLPSMIPFHSGIARALFPALASF